MEFSNPIIPNTSGESDPLVAGIPPLYNDRILNDRLPQPGSSDPLDEPTFTVIDNPVIDASGNVSESAVVSENLEELVDTDANLETLDTPELTDIEIADDDLLTNADDEAIATQEDLTESDSDEEVTVEEDLEETDDDISNTSETEENAIADDVDATDDDISNTSETEEDAIADDVEVAVDPIPEIEPLPSIGLTNSAPGIFTVGSDGTIRIDYNYDHGKFESEVAIVSTAGLENFLPTDDDFSQFNAEVSRRALSNSELGHIVIADATEGARFSSTKWGPNRNSGTYFGVKSFHMNPGDNYMVVMVPNRTFQETLEKSATHSSQRLLFSVSDLNPGGHVQFVQVAAGSADGNLFAFEDLRIDRNSDKSFNDIVLQMRGGEGPAPLLTDAIDTSQGFWLKDMGQALIEYGEPYVTPAPIDLPTVPELIPDIEVPHDDAGLNTSVTRDDDTAEAGLETTVTRDDEVVSQDSSDAEEETVVVDAPTDTTSAESEEVEDITSDDETVEASTGFAGVPTISTPPPEPYNFAKQNQPAIVVIDTGFSGNNPDIQYGNVTSGTDFVTGDDNSFLSPGEGSEHGTHILGIIAATQNNGVGINGVNDDAPIVVIRATGSGRIAEAITEGVDRIKDSGQPNGIINLSLDLTQQNPDGSITTRYELTPEEREAIEYARQNGVILAVAAGNQGGVMSVLGQASQEFDNIITVGAAERINAEMAESEAFDRSDFSSYGRGLDIVAPGGTVENPVLSTVADGVGTMAGTSVATAKVTGAASQIWAANSGLNYRQVIEILKLTSTDLDTPNWDRDTGFGLLNIDAAVKVAKVTAPEDYTPPVSFIPETWGGEGVVTPGERAASTEFMGRYYEWYEYTIQYGDTLSQLALDTMGSGTSPYYNFIAQYNGIPDPDWIYAGDTILLPYEVAPPIDDSYTPPIDDGYTPPIDDGYTPPIDDGYTPPIDDGYTPPPPPPPTRNPYTIQAGDTLWEIAQALLGNGNRWVELQKEDGTTFTSDEATRLQIGQVVYVPTSQTSSVPEQAIPGQESQYIVQPGDTLWEIAYWQLGDGNRWREILKTPGGEGFTEEEARQLQIGMSVYLPITYETGDGGYDQNTPGNNNGNPNTDNPSNDTPENIPEIIDDVIDRDTISVTLQFDVDNADLFDFNLLGIPISGNGIDFDAQFTVKPEAKWDLPLDMELALESFFDAKAYFFLSSGTADIGFSSNFQIEKQFNVSTGATTLSVNTIGLNSAPYLSTYLGFGAGIGMSAGVKASLNNIPGYGNLSAELSNGFNLTAEELIAFLVAPGASKFGSIDFGFNLNTNLWNNNSLKADDTAGFKVNAGEILNEYAKETKISDFLNIGFEAGLKQESEAILSGFYFDPDNDDWNNNHFFVEMGTSSSISLPSDIDFLRVRPELNLETEFSGLLKGSLEIGVGKVIEEAFSGKKVPDYVLGKVLGGIPPKIGASREINIPFPFEKATVNPFVNNWKTLMFV